MPRLYLQPTKGDPNYYRYFDVKAWAAERFDHQLNFADEVMGVIDRNCPKFSKGGPPIAYAIQFDNYYRDEMRSLRRGWKRRFFDEAFLMRFENFYAAQPKRTPLGIAKEDLR